MSDIANLDIRTRIIDSIVETFDKLVSMEIELSDSEPSDIAGIKRMVTAVNFSGNVTGSISIQVASNLASLMTANRHGTEPQEVENDGKAKEMLAEISNIVGGSLISALNDAGNACVISTPSFTYGADFSIKPLGMDRFERYVFNYQEDRIIVQVGLKAGQISGDGDGLDSTEAPGQLKPVDAAKVNSLDIKAQVSESVIDVFDSMFSVRLASTDPIPPDSLEKIQNAGSVSFTGDASGMVSIQIGDKFSRQLSAEMLGMAVEDHEGEEEIQDMMGELGNIVGGNLKSAFTDAGLACALSTPSFTTGTDFKIESLNTEKCERFAFKSEDNFVLVETGVKVSARTEFREEQSAAPPAQEAMTDSPASTASKSPEDFDLELLHDIPLEIKVELGRSKIQIQELLNLTPGSAVRLVKLEGEPVDILANDTLIARGEVVVQKEKYGIRVTEITSRVDRLRSFSI